MYTASPQTAKDWIRLAEPLIVDAACTSQVPLANVVRKIYFWHFHVNQDPCYPRKGSYARGKPERGIYPMLDYTSESTNENKEETTGPMQSSGPNGNWKIV